VVGVVLHLTKIRTRTHAANALSAASMLLMVVCSIKVQSVCAGSQNQAQPKPESSAPMVIQGRITAIHSALVTVKTPDAYPGGGPGIHAQFVVQGPTFEVDVSRARVLLPDGRGIDSLPLAVGDRVLMVLSSQDSRPLAPNVPGNVNHPYFASIVERIAVGDKVITH
jgi:hypothetical protein